MECCGVNNYTDFREAGLFLEGNREEGINRQVEREITDFREEGLFLEGNREEGINRQVERL